MNDWTITAVRIFPGDATTAGYTGGQQCSGGNKSTGAVLNQLQSFLFAGLITQIHSHETFSNQKMCYLILNHNSEFSVYLQVLKTVSTVRDEFTVSTFLTVTKYYSCTAFWNGTRGEEKLYALQVVGSLPRVLRDIESLGHEVAVLKNQMNSVRQDIEKVLYSYVVLAAGCFWQFTYEEPQESYCSQDLLKKMCIRNL